MFTVFQFEDDDIEDDTPLEKRKKIFSKECKHYTADHSALL